METQYYVTLKGLRFTKMYAYNEDNKNLFYFSNFLLRAIFIIVIIGGSTFHVVQTFKEDVKELNIIEDLVVIAGGVGTALIDILFSISYLEWSQLLHDLVDFRIYGEPKYFCELSRRGNQFSLIFIAYVVIGCTGYGIAGTRQKSKCYKIKEDRELDGLLCGMFTPLWLPINASESLAIFLYMMQYTLIVIGILGGVMVCILTWQAADVLGLHFQHLNGLFEKVVDAENIHIKKKYIAKWVQYHSHIIVYVKRLSELMRKSIGHTAYICPSVCGCGLNGLLGNNPVGSAIFLVGWYVCFLCVCHAGQTVINQCETIQVAIYNTKWYEVDIQTQKDILFLLLRSQRTHYLESFPFGRFEYAFLLRVMNTSFSYFILLKHST